MEIRDFADMERFEKIMSNWAKATGLATVAVGADGKYISECYNFTDFCIKYTRGSKEGAARCEKCDREGHGVYHCHAGLIDFGIDLVVNGEKVGAVIGGQVLPDNPDEEKFRQVAKEIGVTQTHLSNIENGRAGLTIPNLIRLHEALHAPISSFFEDIEGKSVRLQKRSALTKTRTSLHCER